jgi:hypothetical protein
MQNLIYISRNILHFYVTKVNKPQARCHFFMPVLGVFHAFRVLESEIRAKRHLYAE